MTATRPPTIPPRTLEHREPASSAWSARVADRVPPMTWRGIAAGVEAALGPWLLIVIVAVAGYVATATSPQLGAATWIDAAQVGSITWLMGHGGMLGVAGAQVTLVPLGITLLALVAMAASVRRARLASWWSVGCAVAGYVVCAAAVVAFGWSSGISPVILWALPGAVLVAVLGAWIALRGRVPELPVGLGWVRTSVARIPDVVHLGARAAGRAVAGLLGVGVIAAVVATVLGIDRISGVHAGLGTDGVSTVVLVLAQLALFPTLVLWATSFVLGPGFAVGTGTGFAPTGIEAGPLPVVPILGALPEPDALAGTLGPAVAVVGVVVGGVAAWGVRRATASVLAALGAVATAAVLSAVALAALAWAASGSAGPGSMAEVGPSVLAVALAAGWQVLAGGLVVGVLAHPGLRDAFGSARASSARWWAQVRS